MHEGGRLVKLWHCSDIEGNSSLTTDNKMEQIEVGVEVGIEVDSTAAGYPRGIQMRKSRGQPLSLSCHSVQQRVLQSNSYNSVP